MAGRTVYPSSRMEELDAQTQPLSHYFSILQRKALTPNDFGSLAEVEDRILGFQQYYEAIAKPFEWRFTKDDLQELIRKLDARTRVLTPAA